MYNQINLDFNVFVSREMLIWDGIDMRIYDMITQFNMKYVGKEIITLVCIMLGGLLAATFRLEDIPVHN